MYEDDDMRKQHLSRKREMTRTFPYVQTLRRQNMTTHNDSRLHIERTQGKIPSTAAEQTIPGIEATGRTVGTEYNVSITRQRVCVCV